MKWRLGIVGCLVLLGTVAIASACNVPVFRFALERWYPDPYQITLLHRGPLDDAGQALADSLHRQADSQTANFVFQVVDISSEEEAELPTGQELPALVVQYPRATGIVTPAWTAPLDSEAVARLTDSPVRQELVRRLAEGQTAVWLLLESGDAEKDTAAEALLQQELRRLEQELELPELTEEPEDDLLVKTPLRIAFSVLRAPRSDEEQVLTAMLLRSEPDLAERSDPLVFPVFGRGRALWALVGAGITAENIEDSAAFLVGACSCDVKDQNPGFDLLLSADWSELLWQGAVPAAAAAPAEPKEPGPPELVPIPESPAAEPAAPRVHETSLSSPPEETPGSRRILIAALVLAGLVVVSVGFRSAKARFLSGSERRHSGRH